jgi:mannose-1-phosphate guanylyltransferase/mannose-6-phosphate isomerase
MKQPHLYAVILAGGSGTRFWPMSRERFPKQLLQIIGEETLIQQTVRRVLKSVAIHHICIVTNHFQAESIKLQLSEWKDDLADNFVLEPEGRNTAPAIGLAALRLIRRDPDATMLVLPADHVIHGDTKFKNAISLGYQLAQEGRLVTFGIQPTKPETGYGYIQPNRRIRLGTQGTLSGYKVARFVEKPNVKKAQQYIRAGNYYWNSGIFLWRASTVLEEFAQHQPVLLRGLQAIDKMMESGKLGNQFAARYKKLPSVSIDYGIMEQSSHSAVVPVDFSWSDVGSWGSLEEVVPRDKRGNVKIGNVVEFDSENTVFFTDKRLVGAIGLSDMVVVDTPDATLICPKSRSQDVRKLVEELKRRGAPEYLEHLTIHRPWGSYSILEEGPGYKVKRISVLPGGRLSLQLHHKRSEHWVVIAGTARVTCGKKISDLGPGKSMSIPVETKHRLENPGKILLEIIEVQNGPYLGEDDIVRYQDDYGRSQKALRRVR